MGSYPSSVQVGLSEDPSLTTYFFPGRDGVGDGDIQMSPRRRRRRDPQMGEEVQC